jgi:hypothetical protein
MHGKGFFHLLGISLTEDQKSFPLRFPVLVDPYKKYTTKKTNGTCADSLYVCSDMQNWLPCFSLPASQRRESEVGFLGAPAALSHPLPKHSERASATGNSCCTALRASRASTSGMEALQERKEGDHGALLHSEPGGIPDVEMKAAEDPGKFSW